MKEYPHQEEILKLSESIPNLGLLWEMGTGKTKATIDILRNQYNRSKSVLPTIIFSPLVTLYNWRDEFEKWSKIPKERIHVISANGPKRIKLIESAIHENDGFNIIIINYEAIQSNKVFDLLDEFSAKVIVADEMHLLKNHRSIRARKVVRLADKADLRYGLTGTPILNNITDLFHQFRFLDGGKLFGRNFWVFQNKYLYDANASWSHQQNHFPDYRPRPEMFEELHDKLLSISTRVTKQDAMKHLPPLIKTKRVVELGKDQAKFYKEMKRDFITYVKDLESGEKSPAVVAELALTKALRLQQICSGFLSTDDGQIIPVKDNPRLKATKELLEEIVANNHKVILWCAFKHDYEQLSKICEELNYGHKFITGGMSLEAKQDAIRTFSSDPHCPVIIANRRAGGIGINLVEASHSIIYSRNFSLGDELQSEARNHRGGSEMHDKIIKIDLVAKDTIDEIVLEALSNKQKLSDRIVDWTKE